MENNQKESGEEEQVPSNYADYGEVLASWQFPEHIKHERSLKWYVFFFLLVAIIITLSVFGFDVTLFRISGQPFGLSFDKNYLFIVLIVLFLILYFYYERKEIENMTIFLTEDGVVINNKLIEYKSLDDFYLVYFPPKIKNLYLQPKNLLKPIIIIPLEDENPIEVREILLRYLKEDLEKEEMPTSESLSKIFKL
jgi:hypothetical protein